MMTLIIDITTNSVMKTGAKFGESGVVISSYERSFCNGLLVCIYVQLKKMGITITIITSSVGSNMTLL